MNISCFPNYKSTACSILKKKSNYKKIQAEGEKSSIIALLLREIRNIFKTHHLCPHSTHHTSQRYTDLHRHVYKVIQHIDASYFIWPKYHIKGYLYYFQFVYSYKRSVF